MERETLSKLSLSIWGPCSTPVQGSPTWNVKLLFCPRRSIIKLVSYLPSQSQLLCPCHKLIIDASLCSLISSIIKSSNHRFNLDKCSRSCATALSSILKDTVVADFHLNIKMGGKRTAESTHGLLKVVDIVKHNEGTFPAQFEGAPLQVGLSTCHLIGGDVGGDKKQSLIDIILSQAFTQSKCGFEEMGCSIDVSSNE